MHFSASPDTPEPRRVPTQAETDAMAVSAEASLGGMSGGDTWAGSGYAPYKERRAGKSMVREIIETVLLALFIYFAVRSVVQNFKVEGSSMEPTFHHGEYLLVNKAAYTTLDLTPVGQVIPIGGEEKVFPLGSPKRGDVVVFRYPRDPSRDFIKRVVALPGETVEVRVGQVYVNGQRLMEPYVLENASYSRPPETVPDNQYFVLGDNRNNSSDSHVWGPVPMGNIIGKAWLTYWPLQDWGSVGEPSAQAVEP